MLSEPTTGDFGLSGPRMWKRLTSCWAWRSVVRATDDGSGRLSLGAWPDQRPLTVYVNRVDGCGADVGAVVVLLDPWRPTRLSPEQVAQSLRLTPAESRVAVALAEGMTTREIAQTTGRKLESVRWLVQRALEKTYCPRQADLVRLVLSSSHLPIAQWE